MIFQFDDLDHGALATLFETPGYAGYKPEQAESPNSDGVVDAAKRYLHVAPKYNPPEWAMFYLAQAHYEACRIAERIGVPDDFYPKVENGTFRVLDYPAGAGTAEHTDFDLFTVNLWRSTPEDHQQWCEAVDCGGPHWKCGAESYHIGRIGEMVGLGPAVKHRVPARPYAQKALIYFAMPAMSAQLPVGDDYGHLVPGPQTVKEWLDDVYQKSRVYK